MWQHGLFCLHLVPRQLVSNSGKHFILTRYPMEMRKSCSVVSTLCWRLLSMILPRVFTFPAWLKDLRSERQWSLIFAHTILQSSTGLKYSPFSVFFSISLFSLSVSLTLSWSPKFRLKCNQTSEHNEMLYWVPCWLITSLNTVPYMLHLTRREIGKHLFPYHY